MTNKSNETLITFIIITIITISYNITVNLFNPNISFGNSPDCLPFSFYNVSLENLVFDQLIIP